MLAPGVESISCKKIFVGGLTAQTTREQLISHFQNFGVIQECTLMQDRNTGRSRCFGFVTMRDKEAVDRILNEEQIVDGKKVDCKHAVPKDSSQTAEATANFHTRKLFVGGLPPEVNHEEFHEYFLQFGPIEDSVVMFDRQTRRPRGVGFVTFADEKSIDEVLLNYNNNLLKGKWIECKKAQPKEASAPAACFQANSVPFVPSDAFYTPDGGFLENPYIEYPYEFQEGDFLGHEAISQRMVDRVLDDTEDSANK